MNYGQIYFSDIANGIGCRTALFVSGCTHHCKGCFNEATWDFNYGKEFTKEVEDSIVESLKPVYIKGLTILGGEPMELSITDENNTRCHGEDTFKILEMIDVLVDGEFMLEKKDISLKFKGSSNQRIIDVKKSLKSGVVEILEV